MKGFLKIILLLAAMFPVWLTIVAMGEPKSSIDLWRDTLNSKLLEKNSSDKKIQILEIGQLNDQFKDAFMNESFELSFPVLTARGVSKMELRFTDAEGRLKRLLSAPVKLSIQEQVYAVTKDLPKQTVVQASDLKEMWVESNQLTDRPLSRDQLVGRTLRGMVRAGSPVYSSQIEQPTLVKMGDRVRIIVTGNGISVTGTGIAKEAGSLGQTIRIMNPDSKRDVFGTVVSERRVEVKL